jgi:hypothetical protein
MVDKLLDHLRGTVRFDISGAGDKLAMDRPDALRDQVRVLKIGTPNRAIKTLSDEIDETIAVGGVDVKLRVLTRHFRKHGGEVGWAESKWHCDPQTAVQLASGEDRFPGCIDLGAGPSGMVPEGDPGLRERGTARCPSEKLDAKLRFYPKEPTADD